MFSQILYIKDVASREIAIQDEPRDLAGWRDSVLAPAVLKEGKSKRKLTVEERSTKSDKTKLMKKILATMIMAGAMAAPSLWAIPSSGFVNVSRVPGYFTGSGGEFTVAATDQSFSFQTFCLELTEQVGGNPHYYELNPYDAAVAGGNGGTVVLPDATVGDPISLGTAYLFSQFTKGILAGYDYNPNAGRPTSAGLLQQAIWWLEDELSLNNPLLNPFLSLLGNDLAALTAQKADANGAYGVQVLNMYNGDPRDQKAVRRQDFLVVPDGGFTLALLGMGLTGLAWLNRRIRA